MAALEEEMNTQGARLREAAKKEAETGRESVKVVRDLEAGIVTEEDKAAARQKAIKEAKEAAGAAVATAAGGPAPFVPIGIVLNLNPPTHPPTLPPTLPPTPRIAYLPTADREKEEEARIAEFSMRGKMMKNYGWPSAIVYVGLPLPFSGYVLHPPTAPTHPPIYLLIIPSVNYLHASSTHPPTYPPTVPGPRCFGRPASG